VSTSHGGPDQAIKIGNNYYCWLTDGVPGQTGSGMGCIVRYHTSDFITWTRDAMALQADSVDEGRNYAPGQISVASVIEANGTTYCFYSASPDDPGAGCYQQRLATTQQTVAQIVAGGQEYFTGYTQVATDTFQRANGGLGANWTTVTGDSALQIASHLVEPSASNTNCASYYSGSSFNNNQYADVVIATLADSNSFLGPEARVDNASSNHYAASFSGAAGSVHNVGLYKAISGVAYLLGSNTTITPQIGDILRISCVGTDISFFQNEHLLLQETDASLASGFPGVGMFNVTTIANSQISSFVGGNVLYSVSGNAGVAGATVSYAGAASGSVTADGSGNYSLPGLANGSYTVTPSLTGYSFSPGNSSQTVSNANITGVNFTASSGAYSQPDCRVTKPNSATSETVNGTKLYDSQTSSNPAIPPTDSRASKPVACGTYPQNSRNPSSYTS
jgi:hypothetical protein